MRSVLFVLPFVSVAAALPASARAGGRGRTRAWACANATEPRPKLCDPAVPLDERVQDLVARVSMQDKAAFLSTNSAKPLASVGLPAYQFWQEALHGIAGSPGIAFAPPTPCATSFAMPILSSSSFNTTLWHAIGSNIGKEARAFYNVNRASGLTYFAPNINVFRDPRWGRGQETPGEDPTVNAKYAVEFVTGMQGSRDGTGTLTTGTCCKHFDAYSMERSDGVDRLAFDAHVSHVDMNDTYLVAFRACVVEAKATSLMCSYNSINGLPSCMNFPLLRLPYEWGGFDGFIVSDCTAIATMPSYHGVPKTEGEAAQKALEAGVDVNCGDSYHTNIPPLVRNGTIPRELVDRAFGRAIRVLLRTGYFDPVGHHEELDKLGADDVNAPEAQEIAHESVAQGVVLLENANDALPFPTDGIGRLALIGPNGNDAKMQLGNYFGTPCQVSTLFDGLKNSGYVQDEVTFAMGCHSGVSCTSTRGFIEAGLAAARADAVVVALGLNSTCEAETLDRTVLTLPGEQEALLREVRFAAPRHVPVVVVLFNGGPIDTRTISKHADAILWAGYPGQAGGAAIAEILFGVRSPTGRLTQTWYPAEFVREADMLDMNMRADPSRNYPGRSYRFYTGKPVYEFGHGLKYKDEVVTYAAPQYDAIAHAVHVAVRNEGRRTTDEIVLAFHEPPPPLSTTPPALRPPLRSLVAFQRIAQLAPGSARTVVLVLPSSVRAGTLAVAGRRVCLSPAAGAALLRGGAAPPRVGGAPTPTPPRRAAP